METGKKTTAIEAAIQIVGTQSKLAELCGVTQSLISQWVKGAAVHCRHFPSIVSATGGKVSLERLLSDEIAKAAAQNEVA